MAKALLLLSVVLLLATAGLGFLTRGKVSELQGDLAQTKQSLTTANTTAATAKTAQKRAEDDLATAKSTLEEREATLATQKAEMSTLTRSLADANAAVEAAKVKLAEMENLPPAPDGTPQTPMMTPEEAATLRAEADRAKTELAEAQQVQITLTQQKDAAEGKVAGLERQVKEYKTNFVQSGLSGRVLAYNPGWNFVVLNIGDKQGLKSNTPMLVVRGGQQIARVRVSSVEPSQAIADVIPGSLLRGETVQPGDSVVYQGIRR